MDTSGRVECAASFQPLGWAIWSDLDPFTQGYIEALFASEQAELWEGAGYKPARPDDPRVNEQWGFPDLAPETLARIVEDCAKWRREWSPSGELTKAQQGDYLWRLRQADKGSRAIGFPPLTAYLGDDGKVHLK
jgi:hypothetical protein